MIDVHKLRVFCSVLDAQSFSIAASQLRLSQPVVSSHVRQLESLAGIILVDRTKRPIGPTDAGRLLYDAAKKILNGVNEVEMLISDLRSNSGERGQVIISATGMLGSAILPPLVLRFREMHPHIDFQVNVGHSREVTRQTFSGLCHFGMLISEKPPSFLHSESAGPIELVAVQARDKPITKKRSAAELIQKKGLAVPSKTMQFLSVLEKMLHNHGVSTVPVRYDVGSWEAAKLTVLRGTGITILPRQWVAEEIARRQLEELKLEGDGLRTPVYVVYKRHKPLPAAVRRFRDFLLVELADAAGKDLAVLNKRTGS